MKKLQNNLSVLILLLFELIVGILLLAEPEKFTAFVIICFGFVMMAVGIIDLIRFFWDKKNGDTNYLTLILAILAFILGCVCVFLFNKIIGLFAVVAVFYGVILIISGIVKARVYIDARRLGLPISIITVISAVLSVILGIVIVINPFTVVNFMWVFIGLSLIFEAIIDIIAVVLNIRSEK